MAEGRFGLRKLMNNLRGPKDDLRGLQDVLWELEDVLRELKVVLRSQGNNSGGLSPKTVNLTR